MNKLLAQTTTATDNVFGGGFTPPTEAYSSGSDTIGGVIHNAESLISNIIGFLTILGGIFFIVYFVIAAFSWVTSGGDSGKVGKARDKMSLAVIGMVLLVMSYGIIGLVGTVVGIDILNPGEAIIQLVAPYATPSQPGVGSAAQNIVYPTPISIPHPAP